MVLTSQPGDLSFEDEAFPAIGDNVDARLERKGKICSPDLHTESGSVWFNNTPQLPIGTIVIASVVSISTTAVNVDLVEVAQRRGIRNLELCYLGVKASNDES